MTTALRQRHAFAPDLAVRGRGTCAPAGMQVAVSIPFLGMPGIASGHAQLPARAGGNSTQ